MFTRADVLYHIERKRSRRLHCISFRWKGTVPSIQVFDPTTGDLGPLRIGESIDLLVSGRKVCIGSFADGYRPCGDAASVSFPLQCEKCEDQLVPVPSCVFEPLCDGSRCGSEVCGADHCVYVAFFGSRPKIGMSLKRRVAERVTEQGADAFAILATVRTRIAARALEKELSVRLSIPQSLRAADVADALAGRPDPRSLHDSFSIVKEKIDAEDVDIGKVGRLRFQRYKPLRYSLDAPPILEATPGLHIGEFVGIKGRFLIYSRDRPRGFSLANMAGRHISL